MNQAARAKIRMKVMVSVEDGRWKLTNDQELSKVLVLLILSATSLVGAGGGDEVLHMVAARWGVEGGLNC